MTKLKHVRRCQRKRWYHQMTALEARGAEIIAISRAQRMKRWRKLGLTRDSGVTATLARWRRSAELAQRFADEPAPEVERANERE